MGDPNVTYTSASGRWRRSGFVIVVSVHDTSIASFPIRFLQSCMDNTWSYVLYVISLLIEVDSNHPGNIVDILDHPVNAQDPPAAGTYRYIEQGPSTRTYQNVVVGLLNSIHFQANAAM